MSLVIAYIASALAFAVLDFLWLSATVEKLYRAALGDMLAAKVNAPAAIAFYLLYIVGLTLLVTAPALKAESWTRAAWTGALLGLVAYGTYDLTNQATLRTWSLKLTLVDMAWGAFATMIAALAGYAAVRAAERIL